MRLKLGHPEGAGAEHHAHRRNGKGIQKFEGAADILVVALIVLLGLAMLIGLVTASGRSYW